MVTDKILYESQTIQNYKEDMKKLLNLYYPEYVREGQLFDEGIDFSIQKRYKAHNITMENNYTKKKVEGPNNTILSLCDYIYKREPIVTSYGTMFKRHKEGENPLGKVIEMYLKERGIYKDKMFEYPKGSEDFEKYNLLQLLSKIDCNAIYGLLGAATSLVFNINVAPSITRMGQSMTSSATMMFEMILANNVKFGSLTHLMSYIDNIVSERKDRKFADRDILKENISPNQLFAQLILTCGFKWIPTKKDMDIIWKTVQALPQEDINRVYFKCNLYEFMEKSIVKQMIIDMLTGMNEPFLNPLEPPKEIMGQMEVICDIMHEYIYYNYMVPDRVDRALHMIKSICMLSDTDSTIISMDAWYRYILESVKGIDMPIAHQRADMFDLVKDWEGINFDEDDPTANYINPFIFVDEDLDYDFYRDEIMVKQRMIEPFTILPQDNLRYSIINVMAFFLDKCINDYMIEFTKCSGSYEEGKKCRIQMKNEFLFKRTLLTAVKKSYATLQELQEGHIVPKNKQLDIKGIASLKKSSMSKKTRKVLEKILSEDILNAFEIDQMKVIKDLAIADKNMYNEIRSGSKEYYKPLVIKSQGNYENPMRIQGIKASVIWNFIKDEEQPSINLDERNSIDVVNVNISKKTLSRLDKYPHIQKNIEALFNSEYNQFIKDSFDAIAIPKDVTPPDWVFEIIDYDKLISFNLSGFPLESIGVGKFGPNDVYTNTLVL